MAAKRSKGSTPSRDKRKATTQPVGDVSELLTFWDRAFDLRNGYRGLVVEVVGRENNVIAFYILDSEGNPQRKDGDGAFIANLDDGMETWSSLPSTAQEVDPESSQRIGYLFVTEAWIERNAKGIKLMDSGGGKWPRITSI
jgi:hypothetical protein